ncbi:MAG: RidA family protein [Chloroflexi bacterium]|nr:RidA family protein [Chloroflexota bacterium]
MPVPKQIIIPDQLRLPAERFNYSPGIKVGNTLYMAGQVGRDAEMNVVEETEAQFVQALENVGSILKEAGGDFSDVVELETWFVDIERDFPIFLPIKERYFTGPHYPTWTAFEVGNLVMGLKIEIKCIAVLDG